VLVRLRDHVSGCVRRFRERRLVIDYSNRFSRENLYEFLAQEIARLDALPHSKRALNVGAGGEIGRRVAALRNAELVNVDLSRDRRPDVVADACDLGCFQDETFDVVFLMEVLEHVRTPERALAEIHRVLKKEGMLLLSTPFLFEIHDRPDDYYRFTEFGLRHLLRGFRHVEVRRRNGYIKSLIVPLLRLSRSRYLVDICFGLLVMALTVPLRPLIDGLDRLIRWDAATTGYVGLARK
jgi:SAM-dependent methyltransferase